MKELHDDDDEGRERERRDEMLARGLSAVSQARGCGCTASLSPASLTHPLTRSAAALAQTDCTSR